MFNRFRFFLNIGIIGMVIGIGMWWMYRSGFSFLQPWWTLLFFLGLPFLFSLPHIAIDRLPVPLTKICAWLGGYWFIFVFYSIFLMIMYFLVFAGTFFWQRPDIWQSVAGTVAMTGGLFIILLIAGGSWNALHPVLRTIEITTTKPLAGKFTIAFATDIHLGPIQSNWYSTRFVKRINDIQADAIILGGDLIDGNLSFVLADGSYRALEKLQAPLGVYAVYGNHDYFNGDLKKEKEQFKPIQFLQNDTVTLADNIQVTGLTDYLHDPVDTVPKPTGELLQILVDHEPLRIPQSSLAGYDVYLAGHTHAGQFAPVSWITERLYELNYGQKHFGRMLAIVSAGYGFWGTPVRIGPAPEIIILHITHV